MTDVLAAAGLPVVLFGGVSSAALDSDIPDFERALRLVRAAMPGVVAAIRAATGTCAGPGGIGCG